VHEQRARLHIAGVLLAVDGDPNFHGAIPLEEPTRSAGNCRVRENHSARYRGLLPYRNIPNRDGSTVDG
jgi:hypothetical protein